MRVAAAAVVSSSEIQRGVDKTVSAAGRSRRGRGREEKRGWQRGE